MWNQFFSTRRQFCLTGLSLSVKEFLYSSYPVCFSTFLHKFLNFSAWLLDEWYKNKILELVILLTYDFLSHKNILNAYFLLKKIINLSFSLTFIIKSVSCIDTSTLTVILISKGETEFYSIRSSLNRKD